MAALAERRRRQLTGRSTIVSTGTGAKIMMSGGRLIRERKTAAAGGVSDWGPPGPTADPRRQRGGLGNATAGSQISALHSNL